MFPRWMASPEGGSSGAAWWTKCLRPCPRDAAHGGVCPHPSSPRWQWQWSSDSRVRGWNRLQRSVEKYKTTKLILTPTFFTPDHYRRVNVLHSVMQKQQHLMGDLHALHGKCGSDDHGALNFGWRHTLQWTNMVYTSTVTNNFYLPLSVVASKSAFNDNGTASAACCEPISKSVQYVEWHKCPPHHVWPKLSNLYIDTAAIQPHMDVNIPCGNRIWKTIQFFLAVFVSSLVFNSWNGIYQSRHVTLLSRKGGIVFADWTIYGCLSFNTRSMVKAMCGKNKVLIIKTTSPI